MEEKDSKRLSYKLPVLLLLLTVVALGLWAEPTSAQAPRLLASDDTFIDLNNSTITYDEQQLEVTYSHFLGNFVPTRWALLQFDLAGVKVVADRSLLVVEIVENNLPEGAEVDLALYGVADSWDKASRVTYDTRPLSEVLLQTVTIRAGFTGQVQFGDAEGHPVGTYLEAERVGDGQASFLLRFDGGTGALGFAGNVLFEDSEGTHDGVNGNEPFIELADDDDSSYRVFLPLVIKADWSFTDLRLHSGYENGLLLSGELVNQAGTSQELDAVWGTFYDEQGRVIADEANMDGDWPVDIVPPGGRVPFVLTVDDADSLALGDGVANFALQVEAEASDETPRQDFEFSGVSQWVEDGEYCVAGELRNPGRVLTDDLVVAVVLYDSQDRVVNFEDDGVLDPEIVVGDQTWAFEACVDPPNEDVARYELLAWGL